MKESRFVPVWLRLVGELFVIVVGVLIALTGDSWIESREDRRKEVDHLRALAQEFGESLSDLDRAKGYKEKQIADLERFITKDVRDLPRDSLDGWIYDGVYVTGGYIPVLSALRDLESSGELGLIEDPAIRRGLALLRVRLEDASRSFSEYVVYHQTVVDPFMANELPVVGLLGGRNGIEFGGDLEPDWSLLNSPRARGLLVFKLSLAGNYLGTLQRLEAQFQVLVGLITDRLVLLGA